MAFKMQRSTKLVSAWTKDWFFYVSHIKTSISKSFESLTRKEVGNCGDWGSVMSGIQELLIIRCCETCLASLQLSFPTYIIKSILQGLHED